MIMETKTMQKITMDMTIGEVVDKYPEIIDTLTSFGVHCVGCHVSPYETIEQGFMGHGMTGQEIEFAVSTLNKVLDAKFKEVGSNSHADNKIISLNPETNLIITDMAVTKVKELIQKENKGSDFGLRVEVIPGGCSGMSYDLSFDNQQRKDDEIILKEGLKIFVDRNSLKFMQGAKIDFVDSIHGTGFKIDNPMATKTCGCGNSFG